jgi:hypothetical protein
MKLIIDIPYGHYCTIKDGFLSECLQATTEAILNGTPIPDKATNGDVIKTIIPMEDYYGKMAKYYYHCIEWDYPEWWNSPYKRGETE